MLPIKVVLTKKKKSKGDQHQFGESKEAPHPKKKKGAEDATPTT